MVPDLVLGSQNMGPKLKVINVLTQRCENTMSTSSNNAMPLSS